MVPQWFKTPSGRSYGAAAARRKCGNPSPPQGIVGTLVTNTLPQFNPIRGPGRPGAAVFLGFGASGRAHEGIKASGKTGTITRDGNCLEPRRFA